jgi:hypothetical protein
VTGQLAAGGGVSRRRPREGFFYDNYPADIPFTLSPHAIERALEMSVEGDEITDAMRHPEWSYLNYKYNNWCLTAGRITVCVNVRDGQARIVSVLWSTKDGWLADYARGGTTDRTPRDRIYTPK